MSAGPLGPRPALRHLIRTGGLVLLVGLLGLVGLAQAQAPPETIEYYATDALGSVRVVFTPMGQVLGRSDYLPFGETLSQSGALPRQRFTGQERDGEAGLDYFNARSLQTRTGRMSRPDPLFAGAMAETQGWNRYTYVRNQPLTLMDPSGMSATPTFKVHITGCVVPYACAGSTDEQPSDAAMEGLSDLSAGGVGWTGGGDFGVVGIMPGHQYQPVAVPPTLAAPPPAPPPPPAPAVPQILTQPTSTQQIGSVNSAKPTTSSTAGQTVFVGFSVGAYLFGGGQATGGVWCDGRGCGMFFTPGTGYGWGAGTSFQVGSMGLNRDGFRGAFLEFTGTVPSFSGTAYVNQSGEVVGASVGAAGGYGGSIASTYTKVIPVFNWCVAWLGCR